MDLGMLFACKVQITKPEHGTQGKSSQDFNKNRARIWQDLGKIENPNERSAELDTHGKELQESATKLQRSLQKMDANEH